MTPLEKIRNGILKGNWSDVCGGYETMTGEKLEPQQKSKAETIVSDIRKILGDITETPQKNTKKTTKTKKEETKALDTSHLITEEPDPKEVKRNIEIAKKTRKRKTTRNTNLQYEVSCSECEDLFMSPVPGGEQIGQKCDKCLSLTKGRVNGQ